jgi:CheY-like chemotaxis protein
MRILIAEDDEALARFVRQGLEGEHYSVDVLPDGEQARAAATQFEYDVVILELEWTALWLYRESSGQPAGTDRLRRPDAAVCRPEGF